MVRAEAPQLRTAEAIIAKHEQIQDALEREAITGKVAEQMNQTLKGIMGLAKLELQSFGMLLKFGRRMPVPHTPLLRSVYGLPATIEPTDGERIRQLLPDRLR